MTLVILYNLLKYIETVKKYKKMAKEDKIKLIQHLNDLNITREQFGNNSNNNIFLTKFMISRIKYHNISSDEYFKYVFPYFQKYLKEEHYLVRENNNGESNLSYFREI